MELYYSLRIDVDEAYYQRVSDLLNIKPETYEFGWIYEVEAIDENEYFDFVNEFLDILQGKYTQLAALGIQKEDISIWMVYGYEGQCDMEFDPEWLKRLGENGIKLCVSCYDTDGDDEFDGFDMN